MSARQGISCRRWSALSHSRAVNTERERRSGRGECQPGRASLVGGGQHCHTAGLSTQRRSGRGECQPGRASLVGGDQHCHTARLSTQRDA